MHSTDDPIQPVVGVGDRAALRPELERNVLFRSPLTGQFYFAPKVRVLSETIRCVVGRKYDVTAALQPYLLKKYRKRSGK